MNKKIDEALLIALISEEKDFNQRELATLFNVSQAAISKKLTKLDLSISPSSSLPRRKPVYVVCSQCHQYKKHCSRGLCKKCYNKLKDEFYRIVNGSRKPNVRRQKYEEKNDG